MKKTTLFFISIALVVITAGAQDRRPVAISPASDAGIAKVGVSCPTFSWTGIEWATGYKVVVFETNGPNVLAYEEMEAIASPVLTKKITGRALSWTPSSEERLSNGNMYVWYVQAVGGYGQGIWSEGRMFEVETEVQLVGMEDSVRKSLRGKGMSEEAIEDVLEDMRLGMKEVVAYGVDTGGNEVRAPDGVEIQGTEGSFNTFYGIGAGSNIDVDGFYNSFFGVMAGYETTTGDSNTFIGHAAGNLNTTGSNNTFMGYAAGNHNTTGANNTSLGYSAGYSNTTGNNNTFLGYYAGNYNTEGENNTFIGHSAGYSNTTGNDNTFLGYNAGKNNITGIYNSFLGYYAGFSNTDGNYNTFLGHLAGSSNTSGYSNTFLGFRAGNANTTGYNNTSLGYYAGRNNITGQNNVFLGSKAGYNETGSNRLYIDNSDTSTPLIWGNFSSDILTVHGKLGIGTKSPANQLELETTGENAILLLQRTDGATTGFSASGNKCAFGTMTNHPLWMVINGAFSAIFHTDGSLQMMNGAWCTAAGKWQDASSRALKENIRQLTVEDAKQALEGLDPVRFNYKADKEDESLGFIAEDVPDLVAAKDRRSMSAMDVVAVLTKVVQEQQRLAEEQQKTIVELQKQIYELKNGEK